MKKSIILILLLTFTLIISANLQAAKWNSYTCDVEPSKAGFSDGGISKVEVVADPDIANNKILKFTSGAEGGQWKYSITPVNAVTIIFRAKAIDPALNSWDVDWRATNGRERVMFKSKLIDLNKGGKQIELADDGKWHIWRITMTFANNSATTNLYKDENPTPIASNVVASATDSSNTLRFGDGSGTEPYSAYYDWIIWTTDGAYSPKDLVIPADLKLTGVK